ncbi:neuroactive polyprotein R15 [Biomphalaria pfeifferi]|uniref:Neuroactive polyprotein R15 n=1 Tax=Biomphalaria pfeifferi TaxID=112525 RepID=A0AAD8B6H8_BIOPF|nr:neuroactive polyprotein R15 [Biomphalaria pfeifferi]
MGSNHQFWILVFCIILLLPVYSAYRLQESDVAKYKDKRQTPDCGSLTPERCQAIRLRMCVTICVDSYMVFVCRRRSGCSIIRN